MSLEILASVLFRLLPLTNQQSELTHFPIIIFVIIFYPDLFRSLYNKGQCKAQNRESLFRTTGAIMPAEAEYIPPLIEKISVAFS